MTRTRSSLALMLLAGAVCLGWWHRAHASGPAEALPFALTVERRRFDATVLERLPAGEYLYLRVRDEAGATPWLVTLAGAHALPDHLSVRTFGRLDRFHSPRLDRDFSPLLFTSVAPAP
jgi:hypothetical protein